MNLYVNDDRKDAHLLSTALQWQPIITRPQGANLTYLVANKIGEVAPWINGVIHNNVGSPWDWSYGEDITHWMPLPLPPPPGLD